MQAAEHLLGDGVVPAGGMPAGGLILSATAVAAAQVHRHHDAVALRNCIQHQVVGIDVFSQGSDRP